MNNDIEEPDLDELVHESAQDFSLSELNSISDSDLQESHIHSREKMASVVNNSGMLAQVNFLILGTKNDCEALVDYLSQLFGIASVEI